MNDGEENFGDYLLIPAEKSGSRKHELLVADPIEGFHIFKIKQLEEHYSSEQANYYKDFSVLCHSGPGSDEPIGKIQHFAMTADYKMIAIYAN